MHGRGRASPECASKKAPDPLRTSGRSCSGGAHAARAQRKAEPIEMVQVAPSTLSGGTTGIFCRVEFGGVPCFPESPRRSSAQVDKILAINGGWIRRCRSDRRGSRNRSRPACAHRCEIPPLGGVKDDVGGGWRRAWMWVRGHAALYGRMLPHWFASTFPSPSSFAARMP